MHPELIPSRRLRPPAIALITVAALAGCSGDDPSPIETTSPASTTVERSSDAASTDQAPAPSTDQAPAPSTGQALAPCTAAQLSVNEESTLEARASSRLETVTINSTQQCSIDPVPQVVLVLDDGSQADVEVVQEPLPPGRPGTMGQVDDVGLSTTIGWRTVPEAPDVDPAEDCPTGIVTLVLPDGGVGLGEMTACGRTFSITPWDVNAG